MEVYPAIDLIDGRCVRLWKGMFNRATTFDQAPKDIAVEFARAGARTLHVVDLDGARTGKPVNLATLRAIVDATGSELQIQWGGGLRDVESVENVLAAGAGRILVGSVAVRHPETVANWTRDFGSECIVVALDVRLRPDENGQQRYVPAVDGWQETHTADLWTLVDQLCDAGVHHILSTDIDRDGTKAGPNLELYREFVERYPALEVQASGGVRDQSDLLELESTGVSAAVVGRALLDGSMDAMQTLGTVARRS